MADFPLLKSGAVTQYPSAARRTFSTRVLEFVDGHEQRFRRYGAPLRRWSIELNLLTEAELKEVENFFRAQAGRQQEFSFLDPFTNDTVEHCSFESDAVELTLTGFDQGRTAIIIRENRS